MTIDKQEFITVVEAFTEEQKRIAIAHLPMQIIEEEAIKRYTHAENAINDIVDIVEPYKSGCVNEYQDVINIIDSVEERIMNFREDLRREISNDTTGTIEGSNERCKECGEDS